MSTDLLQRLRMHGAVPGHIAIIMDGNGRWAKGRSLPRPLGHHAGMRAVREVVEACLNADVGVLTLFAFSQENWQRPLLEIEALMSLLEEYISREADNLREKGVAVSILGDVERLAPAARRALGRRLYTAAWPDPDLLIRTSGEMRISNFLLWQLAYAELYVTPVLWPDFTRRHLFEAILEFQRRERRFGRVGAGRAPTATSS